MIDTLMMAYTVEMISVEKVIACTQQYSSFFQATDLPYDIEDAIMFWINKVRVLEKQAVIFCDSIRDKWVGYVCISRQCLIQTVPASAVDG